MNRINLIRDLCNLEVPSAIEFSPSREQVLYSTKLYWGHHKGKEAVSTLWLATTGQPHSARQLTSGTFNDHAPAWHPNGDSFAFISDRASAGKRWAIYSQSANDTAEVHAITPVDNEQAITDFAFSPDGKHIAYVSPDEMTGEQRHRKSEGEDVQVWGEEWPFARLRVVNLETKAVRSLDISRHITDFSWSPNGERIGIVSYRRPDLEDFFLSGATISTVDLGLTAVTDLSIFPKATDRLVWARDDKLYFGAGVPVNTSFAGRAIYRTGSGVTGYERVAFGHDDDAIGLKKVNGQVVVQLEHRLESRVTLLDGRCFYSGKHELEAFDVGFGPGGDVVVAVAISDINHPVEVYTKSGTGEMTQLSSHGQAFKDRQFGTCHFLSCPSADHEVEIDAMYLEPATGSPKKAALPTIVFVHGGPNTRLTEAFNTYYFYWAPFLLSLGYGVLIPNYRGSRGRGEHFASYSYGGLGVHDHSDIITLTQHAIDRGFADRNRLVIGGWSNGGFLTFVCSLRNGTHGHGWEFQAAIPGAGICDSDAMALTSDLGCVYQPELQLGRVAWNMDRDDARNRVASPLWEFKRATDAGVRIPPMLILHGEKDARCPVSQAWGMRRALESYGLDFECAIYPRQGHFFAEQKFWIDMAIRIGRWCDKYIGAGGAE